MIRVALISLARRGGMVHFHGELVNALGEIIPVVSITAKHAVSFQYSELISRLYINTGTGVLGTLLNALNPFVWRDIMWTLRKSDVDVFHFVASHEWNPILAFFLKILRKPFVFSMHDPQHHLGAPFYMRISDNLTARMSSAIVVLSQLGKRQLVNKGFREDTIYHIPHGDYSFFLKKQTRPTEKEKMILFFGRIEPYKGLDILLRAFLQVASHLPDWKLVIAGNGDITPYLSYLDNPAIEVINRYIDDDEVAELMGRASFVVIPYIEATQSGVIPISYSFARPVIATDVGSLKEMVIHEKTGLLIRPNRVDELIQAIDRMTSAPVLCEQMGKQAYEMSRTEWSWENISRSHLEVYLKIVNACKK